MKVNRVQACMLSLPAEGDGGWVGADTAPRAGVWDDAVMLPAADPLQDH